MKTQFFALHLSAKLLSVKSTPLLILAICALALSCKKSSSSKGPSGPLLTRYVENQNGDSVIYDLTYDNNNRLINIIFTGNGFGPSLNISGTQITRNGAGIITKYIDSYPNPNPQLNPNDTVLVSYDNAKAQYTLLLQYNRVNSSGQPIDIRDSTTLVYDNSGRIIQELLYYFNASSSADYYLSQTEYFAYDQQANIITDSVVANSNAPQYVIRYQYDTSSNPLSLGNEALLLPDRDWTGLPRISGWFSKNNVISGGYTDLQSSISDFSVQRAFNYSSAGLPLSSTDQWQDIQYAPLISGSTNYYY
jgi:hypothetical protein